MTHQDRRDVTTPINVGFISLGCPKNQVDCELMISRSHDHGFRITPDMDEADAIVINTCAFIVPAQEEADEAIREALECKSSGRCRAVVVTGCLPQYLKDRSREMYPQVDAWLTPGNPGDIDTVLAALLEDGAQPDEHTAGNRDWPLPEFLATADAGRVLTTPPSLAYVKIAEGCDHRCRFCIIPDLRGHHRSRTQSDILAEVEGLAAIGTPEIVLVSQDSSYYGRDLGNKSLAGLLRAINRLPGDFWLRVMYLYPSHVTGELLEAWAACAPRVLPYFDVPVQHVSARLLKAMGRSGDRASIDALFARIRGACPDAVIRTSLITGYPGETEEDFNDLYDWVASGAVDRLGVFTYSDLPEMRSHALPDHVEPEVAAQRQDMLMEAQYDVAVQKSEELTGTVCNVLLEERDEEDSGVYWGRTWRDAYEIDGLVRVESARELELYTRVRARITGTDVYDLEAEVIDSDNAR